MKRQHLLLPLIAYFLWISTPSVSGQNKPCNNFDCAYKKAETFLKQAAYQKALDNLDSAEGYLTDTNTKEKEQIKQLRRRLFVAIEKEKEDAKRARDEAKRQTAITKKALAQVEIEKQTAIVEKTKADSLFKVAEAQKKKAQAVLDKIYFYEDKFGLAYDQTAVSGLGAYGFIDKDLTTKIDFKYYEALPFDYTGFAKVKENETYYLIDTTGKIEYKLATDINQLDSSITALDLRNKELTIIPSTVFKHNQLKILFLSYNQLSSLPKELFKLTNLTSLDLRNNQLKSVPIEFGQLTNLTSLDLSYNDLNSLPIEFGQLTNLASLDLTANKLSSFPKELFKLTNLTSLYLNNTQLENVPIEIRKLINLTSLDLRNNQLNILPKELFKLTNLTSLYLTNTQLKNVPIEIGKLINLTSLDLGFNELNSLPKELFKLTNLTNLDLYGNQLSSLSTELFKLANLTNLDLSENIISKEEQEKIKKLLPNCKIRFEFSLPSVKKQ